MTTGPIMRAVDTGERGWLIHCPACDCGHLFDKNRWRFSGSLEFPTFTPSMLVSHTPAGADVVCHSFVTVGLIKYLGDCTHDMANMTVDLPPAI